MSFSPPKKSKNIPAEAQWLGGIGAGSWFCIVKKESNYQITRYSPKGNVECRGLFSVDDVNFNLNEKYQFTYLSHCSSCSITQNEKQFKFSLNEN